jgi:hypothetical protein
MRGPKLGTVASSAQPSTSRRAAWWHSMHDTASDRTPRLRMLASVIGGPGCDRDCSPMTTESRPSCGRKK